VSHVYKTVLEATRQVRVHGCWPLAVQCLQAAHILWDAAGPVLAPGCGGRAGVHHNTVHQLSCAACSSLLRWAPGATSRRLRRGGLGSQVESACTVFAGAWMPCQALTEHNCQSCLWHLTATHAEPPFQANNPWLSPRTAYIDIHPMPGAAAH
jgi:hypothetical protein